MTYTVEIDKNMLYELLIQFFSIDVDFSIIFQEVEEPFKSEILKFIEYIKSNPQKSDLMKYRLSDKSKKIILTYVDYIMKKTKN